jgi:hypothetical protein
MLGCGTTGAYANFPETTIGMEIQLKKASESP